MKVLIAEDHVLFRDALANLLKQIDAAVSITGVAKYSEAFAELDSGNVFDLIILDLDLPDRNWEDGLNRLREKSGATKIVVVTASEDCQTMSRSLAADIVGYIPKSLDPKILHGAIQIIIDGGTYIPINAVNCQSNEYKSAAPASGRKNDDGLAQRMLTNRQQEVLKLIAEGKSNKQIAYEMNVSEATVKLHINALLRTLNVNNRTQAVITAQKLGILIS